jgi:hypothetical protein
MAMGSLPTAFGLIMVSTALATVKALFEDGVVKDCPMPVIPSSVVTWTITMVLELGFGRGAPVLIKGMLMITGRTSLIFIFTLQKASISLEN